MWLRRPGHVSTTEAKGGAARPVAEEEAASRQVRHGEVPEDDVANRPARLAIRNLRHQRLAEEGELIAEAPARLAAQVAGVIPPFRLVFRVGAVAARELVVVAG